MRWILRTQRDALGWLGVKLLTGEGAGAARAVQGVFQLGGFADYLVVNISSPNTPGLRALQSKARPRSPSRLQGALARPLHCLQGALARPLHLLPPGAEVEHYTGDSVTPRMVSTFAIALAHTPTGAT